MRGRDIFEMRRSIGSPGGFGVLVEAREVLQVDVARLEEVRRDGDAEQAVLHLVVGLVRPLAAGAAVGVDRERGGARHAAVLGAVVGGRIPHVDVAAAEPDVRVRVVEHARLRRLADQRAALGVSAAVAAADVDDPAVRSDRQAVRLARRLQPGRDGAAADHAGRLVVAGDRRLAAGAHGAVGPLDRAEQVTLEGVVAVARLRAAHAGVEGAAAEVVATPGDRGVGVGDVGAVAGRRVGRADARDGVDGAGRPRRPLVPDVRAGPFERQVARRRMHAVADLDDRVAGRRRARGGRARADQAVEEGDAGLDLGGRADADEPAAAAHVLLERGFLHRAEPVAGRVEEHDRAVVREVVGRECARVGRVVEP